MNALSPSPDPGRRFRKLRIAWSVVWGVACLLLIALCVRSYWWLDNVSFPTSGMAFVSSVEGKIVWFSSPSQASPAGPSGWERKSIPVKDIADQARKESPRWRFVSNRFNTAVTVPHWFLALVCAILTPTPWFRRRYSVRALLITMTLVALALGLIMWAASA